MQERWEWNTRLDMRNLEPLGYTATWRWSTESSNLNIASSQPLPRLVHVLAWQPVTARALRSNSPHIGWSPSWTTQYSNTELPYIRGIWRFCTSKSSNAVHQAGVEQMQKLISTNTEIFVH